MKKSTPFLVLIPFVTSIINNSSVIIKNSTEIESSSNDNVVQNEIVTEINGNKTIIKSNQPGEVRVSANEDEVKVTTSGKITPTIISSKTELKQTPKNNQKTTIYYFLKGFFTNLFKRFSKKT